MRWKYRFKQMFSVRYHVVWRILDQSIWWGPILVCEQGGRSHYVIISLLPSLWPAVPWGLDQFPRLEVSDGRDWNFSILHKGNCSYQRRCWESWWMNQWVCEAVRKSITMMKKAIYGSFWKGPKDPVWRSRAIWDYLSLRKERQLYLLGMESRSLGFASLWS